MTDVPPAGAGVRRASWAGTVAFVVTAVGAAVAPSAFGPAALAVAVALFAGGCAAFLWALLLVAGRSRTHHIELGQVWFLAGGATPASVRRGLLASLAVEVVAALATAGARPYTGLAAGVLVPMWGMGLCGLWAGRHGAFPPRAVEQRRDGAGVPSVDDADRREHDP